MQQLELQQPNITITDPRQHDYVDLDHLQLQEEVEDKDYHNVEVQELHAEDGSILLDLGRGTREAENVKVVSDVIVPKLLQ